MSFVFDSTAATQILKVRYTDKFIESLIYTSPLLAMFPKKEDGGGLNYTGAIRSAVPSTISATDTVAYVTGNASSYAQWVCPWKNLYGSANVSGAAVDQSQGNANALVEVMSSEFDGLFMGLGMQLGSYLYGDGGGSIGQITTTSSVGTATITLQNSAQAAAIWPGQILQASSDDGTGGAGVRTGTVTIKAVNPVAGTVTATSNWSAGISAITAGDFLFLNGSYNGAFPGLVNGWLCDANHLPTSGSSFNGVDRSIDSRLSGAYYSGNGAPKSESMVRLGTYVARYGGKPDKAFVSYLDYADLCNELGTRVIYTTDTAFKNPQIGFSGIKLATPNGEMSVYPDPYCPVGTFLILTTSTWLMPSMKKVPHVQTAFDGQDWLRQPGADQGQLRAVARMTTYCTNPSWNGIGSF